MAAAINENEMRVRVLVGRRIDDGIREAMRACWFALPEDRRNFDELETQLRRHMERAIASVRDDAKAFGLDGWNYKP